MEMTQLEYLEFCREQKGLPLYLQGWWLDAVCNAHWRVFALSDPNTKDIKAVWPLYVPIGDVVSMPPFTQYMGPWLAPFSEDTKYTTILGRKQERLSKLIEEVGLYKVFFQNTSPELTDWLPFYWAGFSQMTRYSYVLEDIKNHETLRNNLRSNIKRNIAKAEKLGIICRDQIMPKEFFKMWKESFARQGIKTKHKNILKKLVNITLKSGKGKLWGAYDLEGSILASVFIVEHEDTAYYIAGGSDRILRDSGAHIYLLWEAIKDASKRCDKFDFEGSMIQGVERIFREFGAIQTPYFCIKKSELNLLQRLTIKMKGL